MGSAALSIKVFGVYAILTGLNLMIAPNLLLSTFGIPTTNEVWLRVVGVLALVIGYYYWACGVANAQAFLKATLFGRTLGFVLPVVLIFAASAPWQLALFGLVDLAGAAWTAAAMKAERAVASA
jgi:hypothetical protein